MSSDPSVDHGSLPQPRRSRHVVLWVVGIVLLVVILVVAWVVVRGYLATRELSRAEASVASVRSEFTSGDQAALSRSAASLRRHADKARSLTSDPVWRIVEYTPMVGGDLRAVRQIASVVDGVADDAIPPAIHAADAVRSSDFAPVDGRIALRPIVAVQPDVRKAAVALRTARHGVAAIDTSNTVSAVTSAVAKLTSELTTVSTEADTANRVVSLAPKMLGEHGARDYLLLFQNNAEVRASGGISGAVALLHVDNGKISLGAQQAGSTFGPYDSPVLPLSAATKGLYGNLVGEYMQDVTLTPRFSSTAKLAAEMWKREHAQSVDGVLTLDPVTLGYILKATGPVQLATGDELTSTNAVKLLLSDVYARYPDPDVQDAFFGAAAQAVFAKVSGGGYDQKTLITQLTKGVSEGRVKLWSARSGEQHQIGSTKIAGGLPASDAATKRFGVYFNDTTGAKMDYYLRSAVSAGARVCRKDGRPTWVVDVTLRSTAPSNAATALSRYVTGGGIYGVPAGRTDTEVNVYAPAGAVYTGVTADGKAASPHTLRDGKHSVVQLNTALAPGQTTVLHFTFVGAKGSGRAAVGADVTAGVKASDTKAVTISCS